jgi:putrescine transport system substrate-binding protein
MNALKKFPKHLALGFLLVSGALAASDEEKVLNIYNWADYIAPDTISNFEKEFGIKVNYDLYDSTEVVEAKLLSGSTGYDVVFHGFRYSSRLIPIGVYRELDREQLPLIANLDPWVLSMMEAYDPGNRYGIPYMWGTTGFAYNVDMVAARMPDAPLRSAAMLFDPEVVAHFADCGVSLLDEPTDVIPMVMLYLGLDPNSLDPADLARAEAQLKAVRPYIRYFSSTRMINDLPNEESCVAMSWSGDYASAMHRASEVGADVTLAYTAPAEGSMLWFDGIFIPADAGHPANAHLFLNYLMRPGVIGDISNALFYANANAASTEFVLPIVANNAAVYPPMSERGRFDVGVIFGPKQERKRTRAWSRVKTGL